MKIKCNFELPRAAVKTSRCPSKVPPGAVPGRPAGAVPGRTAGAVPGRTAGAVPGRELLNKDRQYSAPT